MSTFVGSSRLFLWSDRYGDRLMGFLWGNGRYCRSTDCGTPTSHVGIILNIFKISGSHILYMMLFFLVASWKAVKVMFHGKVNLADFLMRCLLSLEETGAGLCCLNSKVMREAAGGSGNCKGEVDYILQSAFGWRTAPRERKKWGIWKSNAPRNHLGPKELLIFQLQFTL